MRMVCAVVAELNRRVLILVRNSWRDVRMLRLPLLLTAAARTF